MILTLKIKLLKIKLFFSRFVNWYVNIKLWFQNLYFVFCTDKSQAYVFAGYGYRYFAVKYADKRSEISKVNKLCGGKRHYVITYDTDMLIVVNKIEVEMLKRKRLLHKSYNVLDVFKNAFYVTT